MRPDELAEERNPQILVGGGQESAVFPRDIFSAHCLWLACVGPWGQRKDNSDQPEDMGDPKLSSALPFLDHLSICFPILQIRISHLFYLWRLKKCCLYQ